MKLHSRFEFSENSIEKNNLMFKVDKVKDNYQVESLVTNTIKTLSDGKYISYITLKLINFNKANNKLDCFG